MMKKKNGFTLVELLAVIVVLGVILAIATTNVLKSINDSKEKTKYMAAKEIVEIAEAYFAINNQTCVNVTDLESYLESDATNPETGKNDLFEKENGVYKYNHLIRKDTTNTITQQSGYSISSNQYSFDGYIYKIGESCPPTS